MQNPKNKTMAILIAAILTISTAASIVLIPNTGAHTPPWSINTYAYCNVAPNPAGLGQTVTIGMWIQIPPPTASGAVGDRWHNFNVTITRPDGTKETLGPFTSDDTGGTYTLYTPNQLGNYSFVFNYPGEVMPGANRASPTNAYIGDYFEPSTSPTAYLTVQQDPVPGLPTIPLPTSYWTRPIQSGNGMWSTISGNWLGFGIHSFANTGRYNNTGNYNPYSAAPLAPHIIWTKPVAFGGLTGGEFGGSDTSNFYSTSQYEPKWAPIIMNGMMYYTNYPTSINNPTGWTALNLKTGETIWTNNAENLGGGNPAQTALTSQGIVTVLRCGQLLDMVNPNQYGNIAYLWSTGTPAGIATQPGSTTYNMFDAMTGTYILSIVNGSGLTLTEDDGGNLIGYYINSSTANPYNAPTLNCWNSTQAIFYPSSQFVYGTTVASWSWRPGQSSVINFQRGVMWSKPVATNISGNPLINTTDLSGNIVPASLTINRVDSDVVLMTAVGASYFNIGYQIDAAYSATTGEQLWIKNRTLTPFTRDSITKGGYGLYYYMQSAEGIMRAYDLKTGELKWGPVQLTGDNGNFPVPDPYNSIGGYQTEIANGVLYVMGFGGDVWAINALTGEEIWYTSTNKLIGEAGSDTPYGVWPLWVFSGGSISGNGVYLLNVGHEYSPPLFRGAKQLALNTTDGSLIWSIMGFDVTNAATIVDGVVTVLNAYDNQLYSYAQGPTKMTVTAPDVGVTTATPVTIRGTIVDISAGTKQEAQAANFPNGVPCVSDASQSAWMEYVYMQQPAPNDATGVPISISVLDANGNFREIGTTTSMADGTFSMTWTPDIPGDYYVTAIFSGSNSYYSSSASTSFHASEAAIATTPAPTQNQQSMADLYFVPAIAGLFVAIIVVGLLTILVLRKRP
jgi:hypothetical protein